jgi:hypothetical protein
MKKIIHATTDEEHGALRLDGKRTFSVRLSMSIERDPPDEEIDEAAALAAYEAFLDMVAGLAGKKDKFSVQSSKDGTIIEIALTDYELVAGLVDNALCDLFKTWLADRKKVLGNITTPPGTTDEEVTETDITGFHLLMGAAGWTAPIPQSLGLSFLVTTEADALDSDASLLVIPKSPGSTFYGAPTPDKPGDPTSYAADYKGGEYAECRASISVAVGESETLLEETTGFIRESVVDESFGYAMRRIEQRAGGLFAGYMVASEIVWPEYRLLEKVDPPPPFGTTDKDKFDIACLAWQATSMFGAAFDTLLLAIMMPGKEKRDGQTLAPFLDILVASDLLPADPPPANEAAAFQAEPPHRRRTAYRSAIRKGIGNFISGARSDDNAGAQKTLEELWKLADLDAAPITKALVRRGMDLDTVDAAAKAIRIELAKQSVGFGDDGPEKEKIKVDKDDLARRVSGELAPLQEKLLGEKGTERALVALLSLEAVRSAVLDLWVPAPADEAAKKARDAADAAYETRVAALKSALAQNLNGAEAARQSVGSLIVDLATDDLKHSKDDPGSPVVDLRSKIAGWKFWETRLLTGIFQPAAKWSDGSDRPRVLFHLQRGMDRALREIVFPGVSGRPDTPAIEVVANTINAIAESIQTDALDRLFPPATTRFVPDSSPSPLLVPIALDTRIDDDGGAIDPFTASFAGLGVLVRAAGGAWAHACLADILDPKPEGEDWKFVYTPPKRMNLPLAVAPLPSAVVDGRRELFVTYTGAPFTSYAHGHVLPDEAETPTDKPFHVLDWPEPRSDGPSFPAFPAFAYGRKLEFAVHVIGRSGALPVALRKSAPWLLDPAPTPAPDFPIAARFAVSRRTAIGRVGLADVGPARRIGRWPEAILPLTSDYPRLIVEPNIAVDVFRDGDGRGTIDLPGEIGAKRTLVLDGIEVWSAGEANLSIVIGTAAAGSAAAPGTEEIALAALTLAPGAPAKATLTFARVKADHVAVSLNDAAGPWLLVTDQSTGAWARLAVTGAAVSLADPLQNAHGATTATRAATPDLLLLGSKALDDEEKVDWLEPFGKPATVEISLPRMAFQDFMRWTDNEDLVNEALGGSRVTQVDRHRIFRKFRDLLVALDMDRQKSPGIAKLLDTLPDLAVRAVRLSASPVDSLVRGPSDMGTEDSRAKWKEAEIKVPALWKLLDGDTNEEQDAMNANLNRGRIAAVLADIDTKLRRKITIDTTVPTPGKGVSIAFDGGTEPTNLIVPGGLVVRLSVRPLVPKAHFQGTGTRPPVIDPRLLQHAVGTIDQDHFFDGAHLTIETMIGPLVRPDAGSGLPDWCRSREDWAADRNDLLLHMPAGSARQYHLEMSPDLVKNWHWRQVGTVTTRTQAWRFTGRPIYSWINPWAYAAPWHHVDAGFGDKARAARYATLSLKGDDVRLERFEEELFVGRDNDDARPRTVRLLPLGHATRLVEMVADEHKGATMHRHALELRSRYAAAMKRPEATGTAVTWKKNNWSDRWSRVAVLARRPEGEITRPQLRALVPLTRRPDADFDKYAIAPPVLAILQEEPLAHGGLATRVVSEIRTGVGYKAFKRAGSTTPGDKVFTPGDARREIGPDPRLSYRPMLEAVARRAILPQEGPIGLTFDRDADATAGFANTALVLHPQAPREKDAEDIEEQFVSVALRRYLDPAWLVPDDPAAAITVADGGATVLPLDRGPMLISAGAGFRLVFEVEPREKSFDALMIEAGATENTPIGLNADPRAVDPTAAEAAGPKILTLCEWMPGDGDVSLLLLPGDRGRLSVSAILAPSSTDRRASGRGPVVLASIECAIPEGARVVAIGLPKESAIRRTVASPTTALDWVRTNQDFEQVSTVSGGTLKRVPVAKVRATHAPRTLSFADGTTEGPSPLWIRSAQSIARTPTDTQRHVVALLSSTLSGLGRDIEQPLGAWLVPGSKAELPNGTPDADKVRLVEIETPARITAWMAVKANIPEPCRHAWFDLVSIGQRVENTKRKRMLFRIRPVGPEKSLPNGATITATLHLLSARSILIKIGKLKEAAVDLFLSLEIGLGGGAATVSVEKLSVWSVRDTDGSLTLEAVAPWRGDIPAGDIDAVAVSIDKLEVTGPALSEAWFEISMLVSPPPPEPVKDDPWRFDFDWLFGDSADGATVADFAGAKLAGLFEAQARVVVVSPPIEVER